ncbi:MAG: exonuclease subunit SbcD [Clostridia bacterium]|nr:exonuclease subunit SbcD [Clostridia bacterium]
MRILHTADWHIGNLKGPEKNGKNLRLEDTLNCINFMIKEASTIKPDLAIIAGDIFHQAKVWADRGLFETNRAIQLIDRLSSICDVVVLRGTPNHDGEEQFNMIKSHFIYNNNVKVFLKPDMEKFTLRTGEEVQIVAMPGFIKGDNRTKLNGESAEEEAVVFTEEVNNKILELSNECDKNIPKILVAHFAVADAKYSGSENMLFSGTDPIITKETLKKAKFDLVTLGHIHTPQMVMDDVYYSGAINTITFNDENEKRGFWIHDIKNKTHDFIKTPYRELETISLTSSDVQELIEGSFEFSDVNDKMVRIEYECDDEISNLLNKSTIEKKLYDLGSFFVNSITQKNENTSLGKEKVYEETDPFTNLKIYLKDKNKYDDDTLNLAKEIITDTLAEQEAKGVHGVFEPVSLEVKNYRNYLEESFDFSKISFCVINGKNGSGKSSFFMDAILDALYEEPRENDLTGWIKSDAKSGSIIFTFKIGERLFKVARTRTKSGKATLNLSEFLNDDWQNLSKEKVKDTQNEIINIIGMDSMTFKSCALIMQDQYGLFLQSDVESRMNTLYSILGLSIYDTMENKVRNILTDLNREYNNSSDKIAELDSVLSELDSTKASVEEYNVKIKDVKAKIDIDELKREKLNMQLLNKENALKEVNRLKEEASKLLLKVDETEKSIVDFNKIADENSKILNKESQIKLGLKKYKDLLEKEKEFLSAKKSYDSLDKLYNERKDEENKSNLLCKKFEDEYKKSNIEYEKINKNLAREKELKAVSDEYNLTKIEYEKMNLKSEEYVKLNNELVKVREEYSALNKEFAEKIAPKTEQLKALKEKVAILKSSNCIDIKNANCKFLSNAKKAEIDIEPLENEIARLNTYYEEKLNLLKEKGVSVKATIEKLNYDTNIVNDLKAKLSKLESGMHEFEALVLEKQKAQVLLSSINQQKALLDNELDNHATILKKLNDMSKELSQYEGMLKEYDVLKKDIAEYEHFAEDEKMLPVATERINNAKSRIEELRSNKVDLLKQHEKVMTDITKLSGETDGIEKITEEVTTLTADINSQKEVHSNYSKELGAILQRQKDLVSKKDNLESLKKEIKELNHKISIYETLKIAFSQDGIPHNIVSSVIPVLTKTANNILGNMTSGKTELEFRTEKVLKSNKKEVVTLDIFIKEEGIGILPYLSKSGGEKVKAALSSIIALAEIKASCAGVQLGMLFIDEPPFLDEEGVEAYCDALNTIGERYKNIKVMAITHDAAMKARFKESIEVVKTEEGSKIERS